jgi:putative transposase
MGSNDWSGMTMDWKLLLGYITGPVDEELRRRNAYLAAENRILRHQIKARRVSLTDAERKTLADMGQKLGRQALKEIATVAKPDTILAWHRTLVTQTYGSSQLRKALGRPRIDQELEALAVRMARENRSWGYDRIVGALANLGYRISDQTVGNILKRHGLPPAPERTQTTTWKEFIRIHMDLPIATDFFTSEVWSWLGLVISSLLFFMHVGCRKIHGAGMAAFLYERWMLLILPWSSAGYADVERWIRLVMETGFSRLLQYGERVRQLIFSAFEIYDHREHHQGMGKVVFVPPVYRRPIRDGPIRRRYWLGGLLKDDRREAA